MITTLRKLFRSIFGRKPAPIRKTQRTLGVESLEGRDMPAGISFWDGWIRVEGSAGNDYVHAQINTCNDNNIYNDYVSVQWTHNGVTEQKNYLLYKQTAWGPVQVVTNLHVDGLGGSDTISDLTNLNLTVAEKVFGQGDQSYARFSKSDGKFQMEGSSAGDTASFDYTWNGVMGKVTHGGHTLTVQKATWCSGQQVVSNLEFDGNDGNDTFTNNTGMFCQAWGGKGNDTLTGGWGKDFMSGDGAHDGANPGGHDDGGADSINGGDGDDEIYGCGGNDILAGGGGTDLIYAGAGNDLIAGGDGDDFLQGDAGNDMLFGGDGDDQIQGNGGDDYLYGGAGDDDLTGDGAIGEFGNDYLYGEGGDDHISGGYGTNWLYGGDGDDWLFVNHTAYYNQNTDVSYAYGGEGNDRLTSYGGTAYLYGGAGDDTFFGAIYGNVPSHDSFFGEAGDDKLYGGAWGTFMSGGAGTDVLFGGLGNDTLFGDEGNDLLIGGKGADYLNGGLGDDMLIGGMCDNGYDGAIDILIGNAGLDILLIEPNSNGGFLDIPMDLIPGEQTDAAYWNQFLIDNDFRGMQDPNQI